MRKQFLRGFLLFAIALLLLAKPSGNSLLQADPHRAVGQSLTGSTLHLTPTLGGKQFWADEYLFHQWRIQRNVLTKRYRLLDKKNYRYAEGTYLQCRAKLEEIRKKKNLPPMRGKAILVLHGLFRSRSSMEPLCEYLRKQGRFTVLNIGYPSTQRDVAGHAAALSRIIRNLKGIEEINFVAHSMGNIVIRHYLADQSGKDSGHPPDSRIQRFVMLGPPNQGSWAALAVAKNQLFHKIAGKAGQQLGIQWAELAKQLATPQCEFGIIAGGLGNSKGLNPLLPGDNDGVVTVASTRLAGASDFLILPIIHAKIMDNREAAKYTLCFIKNGYFISANKRHPIENLSKPVEK